MLPNPLLLVVAGWLSVFNPVGAKSLPPSDSRVRTVPSQGVYRGAESANGKLISFYNIPFASPPIGEFRFKPARLPQDLTEVGEQDKTKPGPSCMIDVSYKINMGAVASEDCLALNIHLPNLKNSVLANEKQILPVLFVVHGGSFRNGYSNMLPFLLGPRNLIMRGQKIVIITFNYRLGPFGFLQSEELEKEGNLNLGMKDAIVCLEWVKKNVGVFGGDPARITVVGSSAGAYLITQILLAYDGTLHLFDRAILQSGSLFRVLETPLTLRPIVTNFYKKTNCTNEPRLACLRSISALELLRASELNMFEVNSPVQTLWGPCIDGSMIKRQNYESLDLGLFTKVPLLISTDADEGTIFLAGIKSQFEINTYIKRVFPFMSTEQLHTLHQLYPDISHNTESLSTGNENQIRDNILFHNASKAFGDYFFSCPARKLATVYSKAGLPVTRALFRHAPGFLNLLPTKVGATHVSDLPFWWQIFFVMLPFGAERQLSRLMSLTMIKFASCNSAWNCKLGGQFGTPIWPKYNESEYGMRINLQLPMKSIEQVYDTELDRRCDFFEQVLKSHSPAFNLDGRSDNLLVKQRGISSTPPLKSVEMPSNEILYREPRINERQPIYNLINGFYKSYFASPDRIALLAHELREGSVRDDVENLLDLYGLIGYIPLHFLTQSVKRFTSWTWNSLWGSTDQKD